MAVVKELIRKEENGTVSFGDYTLPAKQKLSDFEADGDIYKVKTWKDMTKLEKNDSFIYESIPGTAVNLFKGDADFVSFFVDGVGSTQITIEMEPEKEYEVTAAGRNLGISKTDIGGKLTFDIILEKGILAEVKITAA